MVPIASPRRALCSMVQLHANVSKCGLFPPPPTVWVWYVRFDGDVCTRADVRVVPGDNRTIVLFVARCFVVNTMAHVQYLESLGSHEYQEFVRYPRLCKASIVVATRPGKGNGLLVALLSTPTRLMTRFTITSRRTLE